MKKISILIAAFLTLGLTITSCNNDDDNASASLEGKWNASKEGAIVNGQEVLMPYTGNETGCQKDYIQINANGTITDVDFDSMDNPCEQFTISGTYTRTGNNITITVAGQSETGTILSLTSTELKVKDNESFVSVYTRG